MKERQYDVVIWGATGFTGQLVAEYIAKQYGQAGDLKWAIAGRNREKLEQVRDSLPITDRSNVPIIVADSDDPDSLRQMAQHSRVICSTVGPYALYGTTLVEICVSTGTDYCDLTGEVHWMNSIISNYQQKAEQSGARIVHTCGFDSIPSDLGTWFLQDEMHKQFGVPAIQVKSRVGRNRGSASGGTIASMLNMMEEAARDSSIRQAMSDPYSLYPEGCAPGDDGPDQTGARYDDDFHQWTSPFIMAAINGRVVRRSNALLGFPWGETFRFDESLLAGSRLRATRNALAGGAGMLALAAGPSRRLIQKVLPKPGEGPSREARERGFYEIFFHGKHPEDANLDQRVKVTGDMDPGYGSTSKMLAEAAVCLAKDEAATGGGIWTPASAMGGALVKRLQENAGVDFELLNDWHD